MKQTKQRRKKHHRLSVFFPLFTIISIGFLFVFSSFYEKSWSYNWNGVSQSIKDSVQIAQYQGISSGVVGLAPRKPKQFDRRRWIMKHATIDELLKLTEYPNGTIKTIAYEGLIRNPYFNDKANLLLKAVDDIQYKVYFRSGCTETNMFISEYLIEFVLFIDNESPPPLPEFQTDFGLQEDEIDHILEAYRKLPKSWWRQ